MPQENLEEENAIPRLPHNCATVYNNPMSSHSKILSLGGQLLF